MKEFAILFFFLVFFHLSKAQVSAYDKCIDAFSKGDFVYSIDLYENDIHLRNIVFDSIRLLDVVTGAYLNLGKTMEAKSILIRGIKGFKDDQIKKSLIQNNLGLVYDQQLNFDSALYFLNQSLKTRLRLNEKADPIIAESYFNLGSLFSKMGDYDKAEELLIKALAIDSKNLSPSDPILASTINNLAVVNEDCGRYDKAIEYYRKASSIFSINPGKTSYQYGLIQFNKAKAFLKIDNNDSANWHLNLADEVLTKAKILLPEFGMLKIELINYKIQEGKNALALHMLEQVDQQVKTQGHSWEYLLPFILLAKAELKLRDNNIDEASRLVNEAMVEFRKRNKLTDQKLIPLMEFQANIYFQKSNYEKYQESFKNIQELLLHKITSMFPSFSEKEREQFYYTAKPYFEKYASLLLINPELKGLTSQLYNNQLATKAILLNYTNRWKRQILNSGDLELIKSFSRWQEMKSELQEKSDKDDLQNDTNLQDEVNALEKKLSLRSELFAKGIDKTRVDWRSIRDSLKRNEAAVEIIRFRKFDYETTNKFTDDVYYCALIITNRTKDDPAVVLFKNGNELETKALKQYRNSILFKLSDQTSYNQFWKPIQQKLKGIDRVFVSPDGIFNIISFNTLRNPQTGKYLLEEIELRVVTNTRDLVQPMRNDAKNKYALLFGGPDFKAKTKNLPNRSGSSTARSYQTLKAVRGKSLTYLPGAKKEVEDIRDLMEDGNWNVDLYEGAGALEENLKHCLKPNVLHIATHGFFQQDGVSDDSQRGAESLLHRSGLMFAGASNSLEEVDTIRDISSQEDGILTAYEAMNLNLENTDLVILSACETGLGEIKNGEGVYGLQRAFRVAGARNLIMSLWKVDDRVTQKLMSLFYQDWLVTQDKYGALNRAQVAIKAENPDPYFWGGFILVGD